MFRLFKHYVPYAVLFLALIDLALLLLAAEAAWVVRARQINMGIDPIAVRFWPLVNFALALQLAMIAVGVYGTDAFHSLRFAAARLLVAICLGVIFLSVIYFMLPGYTLWRSNSLYAMAFAFVLLVGVRLLLGQMLGTEAFKRRVLVMGAGQRAARLGRLGAERATSFSVVGHIDMGDCEPVVGTAVPRAAIENLADYAANLGANEVVLALEERRKAMPVADLLHIRTLGVHVNEISTFLERETGRVDLRSINPSWLIFSDGFSSGRRLSSLAKRVFDIVVAAVLLLLTLPVIMLTAVAIKLESRGPIFYKQERVGKNGRIFNVIKFRSMRTDAEADGKPMWAASNDERVTRVGRIIRKLRIDEVPQFWNILKGEMNFVGPRPERPHFVTQLATEISYYEHRHLVAPGLTGWAQIKYPYGASVNDAIQKLQYDLYYIKNQSLTLDLVIVFETVKTVLFGRGGR